MEYRPIIIVRIQPIFYTISCLKSVGVRKLQVAILALSPREMSLTDRIFPRYIPSRVRVSVRPIIFFMHEKTPNQSCPHVVYFNGSALRPDKQLNWKLQNRPSWVALRRRAINYDVSGCGVQGSEFKPHAGNNIFFTFIVCD